MEREELKAIIENLLLASDQPVSVDRLRETMQNQAGREQILQALEELSGDYAGRNLQIIEIAGGHQLCTRGEYAEWVRRFFKVDRSSKLSQPALDTLSIIAYKQPLTRAEVEEVRGVDSSGVVKTLLEKKIIAPAGRKQVPGRPVMYRTTQKFLEYFGLKDLSDLPTLEDFKEGELPGMLDDQPVQTHLPFDQLEAGHDSAAGEGAVVEEIEESDTEAAS